MKLSRKEDELMLLCRAMRPKRRRGPFTVDALMTRLGLNPNDLNSRYAIMCRLRAIEMKTELMQSKFRLRKISGAGRGNRAIYEVTRHDEKSNAVGQAAENNV